MAYHNLFIENIVVTFDTSIGGQLKHIYTYNRYGEGNEVLEKIFYASYNWCRDAASTLCIRDYPVFATYAYLRADDINFPFINSLINDDSDQLADGSIVFKGFDELGIPEINCILNHTIYNLNYNEYAVGATPTRAVRNTNFRPNKDIKGLLNG